MKKGLSWTVGSGDKIRVWSDPWLSCEAPMIPIGPPNRTEANLMVSDLLCPISNAWDIDKIRRFLPQYEDVILRLITSCAPTPDTLAWLLDKSGEYTTKTGYGAGLNIDDLAPPEFDFNWTKSIWNVKTAPKLKDFLWKVVRRAIPVSANLENRGILPFRCKTCNAREDDLHVFLNCEVVKLVWDLAPLSTRPSSLTPFMASLISNAPFHTNLPPVGLTVPLWPWILWNLWKASNKLCFDNMTFSSMEIIAKAISDAKEWQSAQSQEMTQELISGPQTARPNSALLSDGPPRTVRCNVDAAWDQRSGNCGTGAIFSGDNTYPLSSPRSGAHSHISSALMAEALAIRFAVMYAASSNVKVLMILSDSLSLVKLLKERRSIPALFGIVFDIYHCSSTFDSVLFHYVPRLCNVEADAVAKSALSLLNEFSVNGV